MTKNRQIITPQKAIIKYMYRICGFTLAETLITLLVIGVVAALTIPSLMQQINEYTLNKQRTVFEKKFTDGLRQMRVDEKLAEKYATTADFVNEMKKYIKITAVCDKDHLVSCFSTESFTYKDNVTDLTFNTSDLKSTSNIENVTNHGFGYTSDIMGVVMADGVQLLLMVNPNCEGITSGDTTGNLYSCFKYIADVNGKKSPGSVGKDILSNINMSTLDFEIVEVNTSTSLGSIQGPYYSNDYWLNAKNYCESKGYSLPSISDLQEIATSIYITSGACTGTNQYGGGYKEVTSISDGNEFFNCTSELHSLPIMQQITLNGNNHYGSNSWVWTSIQNGDKYARCRNFYSNQTRLADCSRRDGTMLTLCINR
ncbi:MAG: type II secretion system GspH family protein [bacterium]|nr:type II secretion system GspH family protein [bacterium]